MNDNILKRKLQTRREIIEIWNKQTDEIKDTYCCPACRNLLYAYKFSLYYTRLGIGNDDDYYYCHNQVCVNYNRPILNK
jgi:hypothetical protein